MPTVPVKKMIVVAMLVVVIPISLLWAGALIFGDTDSRADRQTTRLDHAIVSGAMQEMLDQHQAMMEQMRVGATPGMLAMMDADPMWKQMRTGEFAELMEQHQEQIDRMLGLGG